MTLLTLHRWIGGSLQRKLVLAIAGLLAVISVVFLGLVSSTYQNRLVAEHERASMQINRILQAALENAMLKRDIPGLKSILAELGAEPDIARVMILSPEFEVRFSSDPAPLGRRLDQPLTQTALDTQTRQLAFLQDPATGEVLRSVNPVHNREPCQVCHGQIADNPVNGILVVDYRAASIRHEARATTLRLALLGLGIIALVSLGIWVALVYLVLKPLRQVERATQTLARGGFDIQVPVTGHDEIARLGSSFNDMASHLRQSRARLEEATHFLQTLIDAVPDGIRVIDKDFRVLKANAAYCALIGASKDEVLAQPCYGSSHGRDSQCAHTLVNCPVVSLCQGDDQLSRTNRDQFVRKDGTTLHVEVSSAPVELFKDGTKMCCVVESIRNLDQQAEFSHQQRLSEIGLLAAGVAHEIYNPLSSIDLGLNALKADLGETGAQKGHASFETIQTEIQNLIRITDSLMLLSAPSGNHQVLIDLGQVVSDTLSLLRYEAEQKGVSIALADDTGGARILGSDSDIRMLVVNLVINAIHAMPNGGPLRVTIRRAGDKVVLGVQDQGVGIAPGALGDIFMPFWSRRADSSTGRGLGLSIVSAIVDRFGATIDVESTLGVGSLFTVSFPDADKPGQANIGNSGTGGNDAKT